MHPPHSHEPRKNGVDVMTWLCLFSIFFIIFKWNQSFPASCIEWIASLKICSKTHFRYINLNKRRYERRANCNGNKYCCISSNRHTHTHIISINRYMIEYIELHNKWKMAQHKKRGRALGHRFTKCRSKHYYVQNLIKLCIDRMSN